MIDTTDIKALAETLNDLERLRIATENRSRSLAQRGSVPVGNDILHGVEDNGGNVFQVKTTTSISNTAESLTEVEKTLIKDLEKAIKASPFAEWQKVQKGVGAKQAGRLIGALGDPYWAERHVVDAEGNLLEVNDGPRTVNELWSYCGLSVVNGVARKRTKGEKANWSTEAKMRAHLMAESCIKTKGHYRDVYDEARAHYAEAVHEHDCVRCGPSGKPALAGSPLSLGHQFARATRKVSKEILKDLWVVARNYHVLSVEQAA